MNGSETISITGQIQSVFALIYIVSNVSYEHSRSLPFLTSMLSGECIRRQNLFEFQVYNVKMKAETNKKLTLCQTFVGK